MTGVASLYRMTPLASVSTSFLHCKTCWVEWTGDEYEDPCWSCGHKGKPGHIPGDQMMGYATWRYSAVQDLD